MPMEKREEGGWESAHLRYSTRINSWLGQCRELNGDWERHREKLGCVIKSNHLVS